MVLGSLISVLRGLQGRQGQREEEARPPPRLAVDADLAAVTLHDLTTDVEPQAGPAHGALGLGDAVETLEHLRPMLGGDPWAPVVDFDHHRFVLAPGAQLYRRPRGVLGGVRP